MFININPVTTLAWHTSATLTQAQSAAKNLQFEQPT